MFEIYAVVAAILLPAGILGIIYFLFYIAKRDADWWLIIFENVSNVLLAAFYLYCSVVLSQKIQVTLVNDEDFINDLALINGSYEEIDIPTFYQNEDKNNEIEDTRNNKLKVDFLRNYRDLVRASIERKSSNSTRQENDSKRARNIEKEENEEKGQIVDILENKDCFLRTFLYQALLVYSFVTSAIALLNNCQICQAKNQEPKPPTEIKSPDSETFGEKVLTAAPEDDSSENSSENAAPVGPLFIDNDSLASATPNLEVFSVRKSTELKNSDVQTSSKADNRAATAGKCAVLLLLPIILVAILYCLMISDERKNASSETDNILPNFNETRSNIDLIKSFNNYDHVNDTQQKEIGNILLKVYDVIDNYKKELKGTFPVARGQYFLRQNATEQCFAVNELSLKTFDFVILILTFFAVTFYAKISQMKQSKTDRNKCIMAFVMLWTPSIVDVIISRFLTSNEPNMVSAWLLLLGNIDRLYSAKQNIGIYGKMAISNINTK